MQKYIFAYFDSPDNLNHKNRWDSNITKDFILYAEEKFKNLYNNLLNSNTLIIITADHGHNNIDSNYSAFEFDSLNECYIMPPSLEQRFVTFWIKNEKKEFFEKEFKKIFNDEFLEYTKEEFLNSGLLGYGKKHKRIDDFIGDYVAISVSNSAINLDTCLSNPKPLKLSSHCGLTKNEMEVPLILLDLK